MGGVLLVFDVAITLGGRVMAPLDTGIIVVVERLVFILAEALFYVGTVTF